MSDWREKASVLVSLLCKESYENANYKNGIRFKRHRPYAVPPLAEQILECLKNDDEEAAKNIFLNYEYLKQI